MKRNKIRWMQILFVLTLLAIGCAIPMIPAKVADAATGTISATNKYVMISGTYGSTTISWSASGCSTIQVYVNSDNANDVLYSQGGTSGSGTPTWIERGRSHVFKLYAGTDRAELLDTITVIGIGSNSGTVGAREDYVIIPEGQTLGTAEITFGVNGYSTGQVYVKHNGGSEQLMSQGGYGTATLTWIQSGHTYEFKLYANTSHTTLLDTVTVYGVTPKVIISTVYDDDGDCEMSIRDRYEHLYPNKYLELGTSTQDHIDMVISGLDNDAGFDYNSDGEVQENEYEDAAFYYTRDLYEVTYESVSALSVTAKFYDKNSNNYITAGDHYKYTYSNGDIEQGKVKQELLSAVTAAGYDSNNLITAAEIRNYLNAKTVHTWTVYLYGPLLFQQKDVYSMITDYNGDGCISLNERYIHYTYSGTTVTDTEKGYISQAHIDMVINGGFDYNSDGKVQYWEYEDAAAYYTGDTWKCKIMPKIIDTRDYWPTDLGNFWEYENAAATSRLSWIHIVEGRVAGSSPDAYFTKNHPDTYWGYGSPSFCRMAIHWSSSYLYASSTSNYYSYYDGNPDNTIYYALTHTYATERYLDSWYVRATGGGIPYQIFPVSLDVDNYSVDYTQKYYDQQYSWPSGSYTRSNSSGGWEISYEWFYIKTDIGYEGPALRLIAGEPLYSIHEEWYFVEGLGMVRIEQYNTNGVRTFQVNSTRTFIQD